MSIKKLARYFGIVFFTLFLTPLTYAETVAAPAFDLPTQSGTVTLTEYKGKVVYLDFWASWCSPCRKSFPWMNEMERRYGSQGLVVVAINLDKERALAEQFLHDVSAKFTVAYDPDGVVAEKYGVQGMPSSFIIDRDGNVIQTHQGFRQNEVWEMEQHLKAALER